MLSLRFCVGGMVAAATLALAWLLGGWLIGEADAAQVIFVAYAALAGGFIGLPTGWLLKKRRWTQLWHSSAAAVLIGITLSIGTRAFFLLDGVAHPALELLHPGRNMALVWIVPEGVAHTLCGFVYWVIVFWRQPTTLDVDSGRPKVLERLLNVACWFIPSVNVFQLVVRALIKVLQ